MGCYFFLGNANPNLVIPGYVYAPAVLPLQVGKTQGGPVPIQAGGGAQGGPMVPAQASGNADQENSGDLRDEFDDPGVEGIIFILIYWFISRPFISRPFLSRPLLVSKFTFCFQTATLKSWL